MSQITSQHVGQSATFQGKTGIIRFVGQTEFAKGIWVGLEYAFPGGANSTAFLLLVIFFLGFSSAYSLEAA